MLRFDEPFMCDHSTHAIHPNVEQSTARNLDGLLRVIVESRPAESDDGFRKVNAFSLELDENRRPLATVESINEVIMGIAENKVAEDDKATKFRAKYVCLDEDGREARRYCTFRVRTDDERREQHLDAANRAPIPLNAGPSFERILGQVLNFVADRERQLAQYNLDVTDRMLRMAQQFEPLLKTQHQTYEMHSHAMELAYRGTIAQASAVGAAQNAPNPDNDDHEFTTNVLQPTLELAMSKLLGGTPPAPPQPAAPSPSKQTPTEVDLLLSATRAWLEGLTAEQSQRLGTLLDANQQQLVQKIYAAVNDQDVAEHLLALHRSLIVAPKASIAIYSLLEATQREVLQRLYVMAQRTLSPEPYADQSSPQDASEETP